MHLRKSLWILLINLALFFLVRLVILLLYPASFSDLPFFKTLGAFASGMRFDISAILFFTLPFLLLLNLPLKHSAKRYWIHVCMWPMYLVTMVFIFLLAADIIYFSFVQRHATNELVLVFDDIDYILSLGIGTFALPLAGVAVLFAAMATLWLRLIRLREYSVKRRYALFGGLVFAGSIGFSGNIDLRMLSIADAFNASGRKIGNLKMNGIFSALHSYRQINQRDDLVHLGEQQAYTELGLDQKPFPLLQQFHAGNQPKRHFNIVLLIMESWPAYYIDAIGKNNFHVTPNFDRLFSESVSYANFYASGSRSIHGLHAILTGVPVLPSLPYIGHGLEKKNITRVGKLFQQAGYKTIFLQSSRRTSLRLHAIAAELGFTDFYGQEDYDLAAKYPGQKIPAFGWDEDTLLFLKKKLDTTGKPFIAALFSGTTHMPFPPLPPKFQRYPGAGEDNKAGFLNTMLYSDYSIGRFFTEARKSAWFKDTIFIVTADHSEGARFRQPDFIEDFHIPLIIYAPHILQPEVIEAVGSQLDILPTIVDASGVSLPVAAIGESLLRPRQKKGYAFINDGSNIGVISAQSYMLHNLKNPVEISKRDAHAAPDNATMERKVLAYDEVARRLFLANRWSP